MTDAPLATADGLRRLARLARLELSEAEVAELGPQLRDVLAAVESLQAVDTDGVLPTDFAGEAARLRPPDLALDFAPAERLRNAPDAALGAFRVPRVL